MDFSEESKKEREKYNEVIRQMEVKRRARMMTVPTNDKDVKKKLREMGDPICLFGEKAPERRERLREILAKKAVAGEISLSVTSTGLAIPGSTGTTDGGASAVVEDIPIDPSLVKKEYFTEASNDLKDARVQMLRFSSVKAKERLEKEKAHIQRIEADTLEEEKRLAALVGRLQKFSNYLSEVGDDRPLSACCFSPNSKLLATSSWSGDTRVWMIQQGKTKHASTLSGHRNRVADVVFHPNSTQGLDPKAVNLATCSVDNNVLLWPLVTEDDSMEVESSSSNQTSSRSSVPTVNSLASLNGHNDRLCRLAFHPHGRYLASTSFDNTWRLWDVETKRSLLTQSGHSRGTYGIGFHPDGSLCATGDIGGNALLWDVRSGKMIWHMRGHVKQILSVAFSPNGHTVATGSDDHTVKIWDLRKKVCSYTIAAHASLISDVHFQPVNGDYILTSAYDNTCKIWSARDYTLIKSLSAHEGRVMRCAISPDGEHIVSASFDRTWKLWKQDD